MNIAQLSEQLKDVPQNTLIGYAKNPNSVVPQFLALAEIQRRQQLQAPAQAPASTVANDLLAQAQPAPQMMQPAMAQQLPENQPGVAQLPTNLAPQGFAPGGLVAFRAGGVPEQDDEDYEDYVDRVETAKRRSRLDEAMSMLNSRVAGIVGALPQSYDEAKKTQNLLSTKEVSDVDAARKYNVGNLRPVGFTYPGQVGVSKGGFAMFDSKDAGIAALNHDINVKLNRGLDTPTKFISVYAPASDKNDVKAYSSNVAKALGIGPNDKIPNTPEARRLLSDAIIRQEGSQYATANFAKGGIADIPRFATGQKISLSDYYTGQDVADLEGYSPNTMVASAAAPETSRYDKFFADIAAEREALKNQSKQDLALSIMQAGLGMMGSRSPYFLTGVGEGAQQGIGTFAALGKQRGAEAAALRKVEAAALEGQGIEDVRRYGIKERADAAKEATEARVAGAAERTRQAALKEANDVREAALARFNADPMTKQLAKKLEETTPGTPEFEWYTNEFNRLRNNALAQAKVPGVTAVPQASPFPTAKVDVPGGISQWWNNYSAKDIEALKWANEHPLDPRANAIKERFK